MSLEEDLKEIRGRTRTYICLNFLGTIHNDLTKKSKKVIEGKKKQSYWINEI